MQLLGGRLTAGEVRGQLALNGVLTTAGQLGQVRKGECSMLFHGSHVLQHAEVQVTHVCTRFVLIWCR